MLTLYGQTSANAIHGMAVDTYSKDLLAQSLGFAISLQKDRDWFSKRILSQPSRIVTSAIFWIGNVNEFLILILICDILITVSQSLYFSYKSFHLKSMRNELELDRFMRRAAKNNICQVKNYEKFSMVTNNNKPLSIFTATVWSDLKAF